MRRVCLLPSLFLLTDKRQLPWPQLLAVLIFLFGFALTVGFVFGLVFVFVLALRLVLVTVFHCVLPFSIVFK